MKLGNSRREYGQMPRKEWRVEQTEDDLELEDEVVAETPDEPKYDFSSGVLRNESPLDAPAAPEECASVLGAGSTWQGNFNTEGSVRLDGHVSGEVRASGTVHISEGAEVNATVQGKYIVVAGSFDGQLFCSDRVVLQPSSKVHGSITTRLFSVGEGAFIDGEIHMVDELPKTAPVAATAATTRNGNGDSRPLFDAAPLDETESPADSKRNGSAKARS